MPNLYPSWIEIPVQNLDRALAFYRSVFELTDTPIYDAPHQKIALLLASEKEVRSPGVSLVESPQHKPTDGGAVINFHMGSHALLETAVRRALEASGQKVTDIMDEGDGQHYIHLLDSEGNRLALSSYEPLED